MLKSSYKLGTVLGIPIRVHLSLLILLPLLASMLSPGSGSLTALLFGAVMAFGLFGSVALHELGHSAVALRYGCKVKQILLLPIGGIAELHNMPQRPQAEFWIAIAGPAVSFVLWIVCDALAMIFQASGLAAPTIAFANFALINKMLTLFNMVPAFPMDGGRILRALLTPKTGRLKATEWAARTGRWLAVLFGLFSLFSGHLISVAIAVFIYYAASAEYRMVRMQHAQEQGWGSPFAFGGSRPQQPRPTHDNDDVVVGPPPYARNQKSASEDSRAGLRRFF